MTRTLACLAALCSLSLCTACEGDNPTTTGTDTGPPVDSAAPDGGPGADDGLPDAGADASADAGPGPTCTHPGADFDLADTAGDGWATCSADDGVFDLFSMDVSSFARVQAFEQIADLLWRRTGAPSADDFLMARDIFSVDEGIGSRVVRRYDGHYPACPIAEPAMIAECQRPGATEMCPDRCVGPARILPVVNAAFMQGAMGLEPELAGARLDGAIWYFFFISTYKEATSCDETSEDCDSSVGYYRGDSGLSADGLSISRVTVASMAKGIGRYVLEADPAADAAMMEAHLAVHCWREMDNPTGLAMNRALQDQALDQLDRATLRALAVVLRARVVAFTSATGTARAAHWEFLRTLGPAIDRGATARDAAMATVLRDELAKTDPAAVDGSAMIAALDALFPCPF